MILALVYAALQVVQAAELNPTRFYVAGVQQGMTLAEYNGLISNGGYRSKPVEPDRYWATIDGRDIFVTFCQGRVVRAIASYNSSDWMRSLKSLEAAGFRWSAPAVTLDSDQFQSTELMFGATIPKNFTYGVLPYIKGGKFNGRELATFHLMFDAFDNPCRSSAQ